MTQLGLFDRPLPFQPRSSSSRRAAASMAEHAESQEAKVLAFIRNSQGVTREQIAVGLGLRLQSVCARVSALLKRGLIHPCGERIGESGRAAEVLGGVR